MKKLLVRLSIMLALLMPVGVPALAGAACPTGSDGGNAKKQILIGVGETDDKCDGSDVTNFIGSIVEIVSVVTGVAAIIMLLIAGFKYITSGGDSGKISSAKNTLIYAMVGIAVAVLAQVIVNFVIGVSNSA